MSWLRKMRNPLPSGGFASGGQKGQTQAIQMHPLLLLSRTLPLRCSTTKKDLYVSRFAHLFPHQKEVN